MPEAPLQLEGGPTQDERTMAILAHVLQIVGWWIAPLIIFLIKRESRFASFHALQALFLQILYMFLMVVFMVVWFAGVFMIVAHGPAEKGAAPPAGFFVLMPIIWLGWMLMWGLMIVVAIVYGIKAGQGEWAEYPVLGRLARSVLGIGPGGAAIP
jgi:uncharacterized Tic20 family protein